MQYFSVSREFQSLLYSFFVTFRVCFDLDSSLSSSSMFHNFFASSWMGENESKFDGGVWERDTSWNVAKRRYGHLMIKVDKTPIQLSETLVIWIFTISWFRVQDNAVAEGNQFSRFISFLQTIVIGKRKRKKNITGHLLVIDLCSFLLLLKFHVFFFF